MKRFLPIVMLLMTGAVVAPAAKADLTHRLTSSTALTVDAAGSAATRIGATYAVSGTNIEVSDANGAAFGGLTCLLYTSPSPRDRQKSRMPSSA